jgi:hypothetical protein
MTTSTYTVSAALALSLLLLTCWVVVLKAILPNERSSSRNERRLLKAHPPPKRSLNVLSLGGSVTWGSGLDDRRDLAYPSLLLKDQNLIQRSDNLAIRASSAVWPSQCLQTMIRQDVKVPGTTENEEIEYDVILLEFSLNGLMGLQLLLHRIRRRYPNALLIYIDLYSNRRPGFSNCIGSGCRMTPTRLRGLIDLLNTVDAQMLQLPRPQDAQHWEEDYVKPFFARDFHHLSAVGHEWVANQVLQVISQHPSVGTTSNTMSHSGNHEKGDWLEGDLCFSWFKSGHVPQTNDASRLKLEGGTLNEFAKLKYAYEIPSHASIQLDTSSLLKGSAPLVLVYMTKQNLYPRVSISLNEDTTFLEMDSISPAKWADDHVTATQSLGIVEPSSNIHVQIETLRNLGSGAQESEEWPFRLVGIIMCAACRTFDPKFAERGCQQRACVDFVEDW